MINIVDLAYPSGIDGLSLSVPHKQKKQKKLLANQSPALVTTVSFSHDITKLDHQVTFVTTPENIIYTAEYNRIPLTVCFHCEPSPRSVGKAVWLYGGDKPLFSYA